MCEDGTILRKQESENMKLNQLKVNHLKNPLGFSVKNPSFSFQVAESSGSTLKAARIRIAEKKRHVGASV